MIAEIQPHIEEIKKLCRKYHFSKLWVFGSVLTSEFRTDSDIDILYELDHSMLPGLTSINYFFAFKDQAEKLLRHPVDLVWYPGLRNPYFKEEVDETKILIYDAEAEKVSV
ncbi:MAG: nucleotidyltransferase domain-containing protein [Bacteroidia bacterium]|nr:nucleotidyltransferase domain-containing protein [Bacteroidia bacterium]